MAVADAGNMPAELEAAEGPEDSQLLTEGREALMAAAVLAEIRFHMAAVQELSAEAVEAATLDVHPAAAVTVRL